MCHKLPAIDLVTVRSGVSLNWDVGASLIQPISHGEIDRALFAIDDTKAPGIDGLNAVLFEYFDVYRGVFEYFEKICN